MNKKEIWTLDAETDPFKKGRLDIKPFVWGCYNGSEYHEFSKTKHVVEFFRDKDVIVYAHNGGRFDYHFMLDYFDEFEPVMIIAGRIAKFNIGLAQFRDSANILPIRLSDYKKDDFDYEILEKELRNIPENKIKISKYLKNDCIYLHEIVTRFIDDYGLHLTFAGAAMHTWSKMTNIKPPKTTKDFYEGLADYYYGGRVEAFKKGIIDYEFKVIDVNSMYPTAMMEDHPYGDYYYTSKELPKSIKDIQKCFISIECASHGALPFRSKTGLIFPNDDEIRVYNITGWEYIKAFENNAIANVKIVKCIKFDEHINFKSYINFFFEMKKKCKQNGDRAGYLFAKFMLNSLYGKFGSNPDKYDEYMVVKPYHVEATEIDGYKLNAELGPWGLVSKPLDEHKQHYYNVAVSASITGWARAHLFDSIKKCEGVMYCDTDSIACTSSGSLELDPTRLGAWDIEAECDYGAIGGKKLYSFHNVMEDKFGFAADAFKIASKGVSLTNSEITAVAQGYEVEFESHIPSFSTKRGKYLNKRKIKMIN